MQEKKELSVSLDINPNYSYTEKELELIQNFDFFLSKYNTAQKKAIISSAEKILCVAGAGSGKTSVLTKRIEFLTQFKSVEANKILAITFTRKARAEVMNRLANNPFCNGINIETFNSFSEKILGKYGNILYTKNIRFVSFDEKIKLVNLALNDLGMDFHSAIDLYFSIGEKRGRTNEELIIIFTNDCFFVLDYCKNHNKNIDDAFNIINVVHGDNSKLVSFVYRICSNLQRLMNEYGLRDYSDQLVDCLRLFRTFTQTIPCYKHILIDEYQDINCVQEQLIDVLSPINLFCVGDPRQAIFGWRGSKMGYIYNFSKKYPNSELVNLTTNYRSGECIIELMNNVISNMALPNLEASIREHGEIRLFEFEDDDEEMQFIIKTIKEKRMEIGSVFVLGRTNKIILELSDRLKLLGVRHSVKTDDIKRYMESDTAEITLATIHSIKGMEADTVFVVGCTNNNFPCRASEHPVIEMIKIEEYDKEEEERRLLYVAISRAKKRLYISYTKSLTKFIDEKMKSNIPIIKSNRELSDYNSETTSLISELKKWRTMLSSELGIPAYMVMHDRTIIELSVSKPLCSEDLENIHGMGYTKIKKYGEDILRIVSGIGSKSIQRTS